MSVSAFVYFIFLVVNGLECLVDGYSSGNDLIQHTFFLQPWFTVLRVLITNFTSVVCFLGGQQTYIYLSIYLIVC